jgi:hypothetical protein
MIMVLGLRNARRARNLSLLASVEGAAPTFIVRIFELGESGNMREALDAGYMSLTPWGKTAEFPRNLSNLEQPRHTAHEIISYGDRATGN